MSEGLRATIAEIVSLVRATDTFRSVTIGAADGLDKQANGRKSLAAALRNAKDRGVLTDAKRIDHEAEVQEKFAKLVRGLAEGGDA